MTNPHRALDHTTPEGQAINDLYDRIIASANGSNDWGADQISVVTDWLTELGFTTTLAAETGETTIVPNPTLTQYRRNDLIVMLQDSGLTERAAEAVVSEYTTRVLTDDRARNIPLTAADTSAAQPAICTDHDRAADDRTRREELRRTGEGLLWPARHLADAATMGPALDGLTRSTDGHATVQEAQR